MKLLSALLVTACLAAPLAAQNPAAPATAAADVLGTWNATFTTQQGQIPAQIKLDKTGDKITGTIASQMGESKLEAEVKAKAVSMWFTMSGQNGPIAIELLGTVEGDTLKGTATAAGSPAGDFVATRAPKESKEAKESKEPAPSTPSASLTGRWNVSVELPNMTATPAIELKQDGEKLTGEYISAQYGKYPITGTVKGADVTFWFAMNVEGTALNVTYTGKIEKGEVKGSVNYGDMMNGTFTATKK
jgi:hypothetical protein